MLGLKVWERDKWGVASQSIYTANQTPLLWYNIVHTVYIFLAQTSSLIGILKDANFIWPNYIPLNHIFTLVATVTLFCRTANSIHPSFSAAWHCMVYCMLNAALLNKHVWNSVIGMCLCYLSQQSHP